MKIDREGTFILEITGSSFGETKNGFPQWVLQGRAVKFYANTPELLAYYGITEPAFVEWERQEFGPEYLVLFKDKDTFDKSTALLNAEQAVKAVGWTGQSFDDFGNGSFVGKQILGRFETHSYDGKDSIRLNWVDAPDANPERTLKAVDPETLKAFNKKLKFAAPPKPAGASADKTPPKSPPAPAAVATTPVVAAAPPAAKPGRPPKPKTATASSEGAPTEFADEAAAWAYAVPLKGITTDAEFQDAWISSRGEVSEKTGSDEDSFAPKDWAEVVKLTLKDLAAV